MSFPIEQIAGAVLLALSLVLNAFLFWSLKSRKTPRSESYEVRELIHDLTAGAAMVEIRRIAPADVFLRSPRHG